MRLPRAPLDIEVLSTAEVSEALAAEWDALAEATGMPVRMTSDWIRIWCEHYAEDREVRLFVLREGEELAGIVPMVIDDMPAGPLGLRVARLAGSDSTTGVLDLPIRPVWTRCACDQILDHLFDSEGCDAVHFGPVSDVQGRATALRQAIRRRIDVAELVRDRVEHRHAVVALPSERKAYQAGLSRNQRKALRRGWKEVQSRGPISCQIIERPVDVLPELADFCSMHTRQWRQRGRNGHFFDWPGAVEYHQALAIAMSHHDRVRFLRLSVGEEVVARQYAYLFGSSLHCLLAARSSESHWRRTGIGRLSLVHLLESMIEEGAQSADLGEGVYAYKDSIGAALHPVRSMLAVAPHSWSKWRSRLLIGASELLDRVYYRLWFLRMAPRLGRQHALARAWVRTRF